LDKVCEKEKKRESKEEKEKNALQAK